METAEISTTLTARVPAKYVPLIKGMLKVSPDLFQEIANQWIAQARLTAAKAGVEVDDLIAAAADEGDEA